MHPTLPSGSATNKNVQMILPGEGRLSCDSRERLKAILCKPKILPIKSFSLERLETLEKKIKKNMQKQREEEKREKESEQNRWGSAKVTYGAGAIPGNPNTSNKIASPVPSLSPPPFVPSPSAPREVFLNSVHTGRPQLSAQSSPTSTTALTGTSSAVAPPSSLPPTTATNEAPPPPPLPSHVEDTRTSPEKSSAEPSTSLSVPEAQSPSLTAERGDGPSDGNNENQRRMSNDSLRLERSSVVLRNPAARIQGEDEEALAVDMSVIPFPSTISPPSEGSVRGREEAQSKNSLGAPPSENGISDVTESSLLI